MATKKRKARPFATTYGKAGGGSIGRLARYQPSKKPKPPKK